MGDLNNIDLLKDDNESHSWLETMEDYKFTQLINEATRIPDKSRTLIDHSFTTIPHIMPQSHCPESTPKRGRMDNSS